MNGRFSLTREDRSDRVLILSSHDCKILKLPFISLNLHELSEVMFIYARMS